jgi:amino acid transporter
MITHRTSRLLRPLQLTAVVFFTVSGGPYGLEPLLNEVGAPAAILLICLIPILWSLPSLLMVLELNSMMPLNGGYYQWVKTGLGLKWGFLEGWWTWIFTFVDLGIYPVLFVQYLSFFFPEIASARTFICLAIIWGSAGLNLLGIVPVGRSSIALGIAVLTPFLILPFYALFGPAAATAIMAPGQAHPASLAALAMGMVTVMWNYLGWDNASPYAEEVEQPIRSYLTAMVAAFVIIVLMYALAVLAAAGSGADPALLESQGFPYLGTLTGGHWLGAILSAGGMASALGLFLSIFLSISRIPKAMADDGLLPRVLTRLHPRYNVPHVSILLCAFVVSGMVLWKFDELLIIDVTIYSAELFLQFLALIALRVREPELPRPFKIPLNIPGLIVMTAVPAACVALALYGLLSSSNIQTNALTFAGIALLTGPLAWWVIRKVHPGIGNTAARLPGPVTVANRRSHRP